MGERLKKLSREAQVAKKEMKDKVAQVNLGMKRMRDTYNAFERVVMSVEVLVASGTDPSVNGAQKALVVFEEGEGSNVALGKSAWDVPMEVPKASDWRPAGAMSKVARESE